jgi:predicted PurR-regulated permease PerM
MAILAVLGILCILLPVGVGVVLGSLLAFALRHWYTIVARKTKRPVLVALGLTILASIVVAGTLGLLVYLLVLQGVSALSSLPGDLSSGGGVDTFIRGGLRPLAPLHLDPENVVSHLRDAVGNVASSLAAWAAQMVGIVVDGLLALFFMAMTMYSVLRNWPALARRAESLMPINPHHTRRLMRKMQRLGRTVLIGNFGTALVQGLAAGVGYGLGHVPHAALLGAVTGLASLVPAFGTLLVWVPVVTVLVATGHAGAAVFELVWASLVVVLLCDYFVRPKLVGRGETMSTWMMFVALFGGIKLFGFIGFLLGPLAVGFAIAVLRIYERARRFRLGLS